MRGGTRGWLAGWLVAVGLFQVACLELVRRVFVGTTRGQLLDTAALAGNVVGQRHVEGLVELVLGALSAVSLVAAAVAVLAALARGRVALAVAAVLLIAGANLTTQLLKQVVHRPELGVDVERAVAGNSLPSGHTTVAASAAVALVLVLPARFRGVAALLGAGYAALAGVATVSADWHRPSDAVASLLVVGAWAAAAGLLVVMLARGGVRSGAGSHGYALAALTGVGVVLLAVAAVAMVVTDAAAGGVELFTRGRLLTAYAGGAAGIAGIAALVVGLVLAIAGALPGNQPPASHPRPTLVGAAPSRRG